MSRHRLARRAAPLLKPTTLIVLAFGAAFIVGAVFGSLAALLNG